MSDLKEELRKAFSNILGEELKGNYSSTAEVVADFNKKWQEKKDTEKDLE